MKNEAVGYTSVTWCSTSATDLWKYKWPALRRGLRLADWLEPQTSWGVLCGGPGFSVLPVVLSRSSYLHAAGVTQLWGRGAGDNVTHPNQVSKPDVCNQALHLKISNILPRDLPHTAARAAAGPLSGLPLQSCPPYQGLAGHQVAWRRLDIPKQTVPVQCNHRRNTGTPRWGQDFLVPRE